MEITSAADQKMDYLTLLVTELQNQNPLDPLEQKDMAAQLAQFSQLELTEGMNGNIETMNETMGKLNESFQGQLMLAEMDHAKSYLGRQVSFYSDKEGRDVIGKISKVSFDEDLHSALTAEYYSEDSGRIETTELQINQIRGVVLE